MITLSLKEIEPPNDILTQGPVSRTPEATLDSAQSPGKESDTISASRTNNETEPSTGGQIDTATLPNGITSYDKDI